MNFETAGKIVSFVESAYECTYRLLYHCNFKERYPDETVEVVNKKQKPAGDCIFLLTAGLQYMLAECIRVGILVPADRYLHIVMLTLKCSTSSPSKHLGRKKEIYSCREASHQFLPGIFPI